MPDYYGTLPDATAYHVEMGNAAWAANSDDSAKQAALLRASVWVDATYRSQFPGCKTGARAQIREWPRSLAEDQEGMPIPVNEVPREILSATYEAALRELVTPGYLAPDINMAAMAKREKVGSIEVEYRDLNMLAGDSLRPMVTMIDDILAPLLGSGGDAFISPAVRGW